uniref:Nad-Dependent Dna Ligase n=1 Tax=Florenciella sp. virus SA2 TaxID=3240092 RepID=A0AB39JBW8_9VIRU
MAEAPFSSTNDSNFLYMKFVKDISLLQTSESVSNYYKTLEETYNKAQLYELLKDMIGYIDDLYYNEGTSPWSDNQYDCFLEIISSKYCEFDKNNSDKIGSDIKLENNIVKLPYFMASMNKYKKLSEIQNWQKKFSGDYAISAKLDGISALYHNNKLYTRGNGIKGRDISFLLPFLNLPKNLDYTLRGELIMKKSVFSNKYGNYANARNLVCGLLNRVYTEENNELYNDIDFVAYDIYYYNPLQFYNKIKILTSIDVLFVINILNITDLSISNLDNILNDFIMNYDYEIDGIIITSNKPVIHPDNKNPEFAFAYKNNELGVEKKDTIVEKIIWNISKDNYLKPKIKFVSSINCNNSTIEYVTGFNAKYIVENKIRPGTRLQVGLSGNVIPHIFNVYNDDENVDDNKDVDEIELFKEIPEQYSNYEWSKNKVDLLCVNTETPSAIIKRNMVFFKMLELKCGLQETTLQNIYKTLNIYLLKDVLSLSLEQWVQVEKVGEKKATKIIDAFYENLHWPCVTEKKTKTNNGSKIDSVFYALCKKYLFSFLVGLQSFSRGFSIKKIEYHFNYLFNLSLSSKIDFDTLWNIDYLLHPDTKNAILNNLLYFKTLQVTEESILLFYDGYVSYIKDYELLREYLNANSNIELPELAILINGYKMILTSKGEFGGEGEGGGVKLNGYNVVFSGVRNKEKEQEFVDKGYTISDSVNSKTKILVVKDTNTVSSKVKKAKSLNVQIVTLESLSLSTI